ncbi:Spo0E family sporulation regulatory protein-aspartic acid phosphatase (plasmid) [Peribacillus sp. JNUCC 23]|uniref:Spo0E family sporulation regulatory protein-aspartic acid phosphatase n=1 Tax=Peribacillus sp. NPDC096379 TaxID=3364393 RepID=UPI003828D576
MIFIELDAIEYRINQLRKELFQIAKISGLNSRETIYCSQQLDQLITIYQKFSYKK